MRVRFIFAAVLSVALLATSGSASAQAPISTTASQQFIRMLLKPNPALWTDAGVTAYRGATALGVLNPGVAIATTILGVYLMQCSQSSFANCLPSVQIAGNQAHPDVTGPGQTITKPTITPTAAGAWVDGNATYSGSPPVYTRGTCTFSAGNSATSAIACVTAWLAATNPGYCYNVSTFSDTGSNTDGYAAVTGTFNGGSGSCSQYPLSFTVVHHCDVLGTGWTRTSGTTDTDAAMSCSGPPTQQCPSGYSDNGNGTCTQVGAVVADAIPTSVSGPSAWNDPAAPYTDPDNSGVTQPSAPYTWTGTDEYGNPQTITVTRTNDGGFKVEVRTQGKYSDGSPQTLQQTFNVGPSGNVTNNYWQVYGGNITVTPPSAPTTGTTPTPISVDLPTDYAREPTQQAVKANTDTLVQQGVDTKADRDAAKALGDTWSNPSHTDGGRNTVQGLNLPQQWTPPDTSGVIRALPQGDGSCTTLAVSLWHMPTMTLDPCPIVTVARPIINWFALALSTLAAGFAVLRGSHAEA